MPAKTPKPLAATSRPTIAKVAAKPVVLLSGGNPQIAKADGDAPVQAYIAAMPGWTRQVGADLDALVMRTLPGPQKAVKWNSPLYGSAGLGWFLGVRVFARYVKLTFFNGASLTPMPPIASKVAGSRSIKIFEGDAVETKQMADWIKQAAALPGFLAP